MSPQREQYRGVFTRRLNISFADLHPCSQRPAITIFLQRRPPRALRCRCPALSGRRPTTRGMFCLTPCVTFSPSLPEDCSLIKVPLLAEAQPLKIHFLRPDPFSRYPNSLSNIRPHLPPSSRKLSTPLSYSQLWCFYPNTFFKDLPPPPVHHWYENKLFNFQYWSLSPLPECPYGLRCFFKRFSPLSDYNTLADITRSL